MGRLEGKKALITGGSRGIGRAIAIRFAEEGADTIINYRSNHADAMETCREIEKKGRKCLLAKYDVSNEKEARELAKFAIENFGKIDILVNNAGIMITGEIEKVSMDEMERMFRTNVYSMVYMIESLHSNFKKNGGKIINIASVAGIGTALKNTTLYSITKGAVITLTKRYAFDLGPYKVNVNAIAPGFIETDMTKKGKSEDEWLKTVNEISSRTLKGRIGRPEDIANAALFLASDESDFITGQTIVVDGGRIDYLTHSL